MSKESIKFNWGKYQFSSSEEIKMPRNEFIHYMNSLPIGSKNDLFIQKNIHYQQLERLDENGQLISVPIKTSPSIQKSSGLKADAKELLKSQSGDRYFFKNICIESPPALCSYSFSVLILDDDPSLSLPKVTKSDLFVTQYIIDGKVSNVSSYNQLTEKDILEVKILNKFGEESTTENEDRMIIVKTKK